MKTKFNTFKAQKNPELGFRIHFLVFLFATPLAWLIWYLTNSDYPWPIWSTLAWAVGILFHYLCVYIFPKNNRHADK